ncbi:cytochrome c3 family protein [Carboxydothermus ferrireducens]|uniref:CXXCH cytochrome family protein n=1 Tax=Carboxydothermus ferrireducens DSM 11255 TaxID=1119529 RepID=A0ABX2R617_9THEO|nr:cytochrome c3 family protein [Carboxydothermus ferrireducens]NYE56520.1 putative CXXCH cytochrome family protein [Carboxydothermus ferrireducens DSM 11255]
MKGKIKVLCLLILALLILGSNAYAAQLLTGDTYAPTVKKVYDEQRGMVSKFNADDKTYYPNEIYLPNEANPANYRIHTNYSKNTDACAACHATHTAVGQTLLQWGTVYDTCMACHDGTISTTYDVQSGTIAGTGKPTYGGMFGSGNEDSLSNHLVTGAVQIFAAPGGNVTGNYETNDTPDKAGATAWDITFGCESCHSPHGLGGNARILNPNVNAYSYLNYKSNVAYVYNSATGYYENSQKYQWVRSYPYNKGTQVWVQGQLKTEGVDYLLDGTSGETRIKLLQENGSVPVVYAYFYPALQVKMEVKNYLQSGESVQHTSGINQFCGACHTDYNTDTGDINTSTGSSDKLTGQYTEAYRHQVGFKVDEFKAFLPLTNMVYEKRSNGDVMTCLTCHYAHGVSKEFWKRTLLDTTNQKVYGYWSEVGENGLKELAGSSALKRAPNMGTCETCHRKGPAAEGYNANTGQSVSVTATTYESQTGATAVGSGKCQSCHPKYYTGWSKTAHFDNGVGCEACHGNGSLHVKAPNSRNIINPATKNVEGKVDTCGTANCHGKGATKRTEIYDFGGVSESIIYYSEAMSQVQEFKESKHYSKGGVYCSTCHNPHGMIADKNGIEKQLKYLPNALCGSCHDTGAAFDWATFMPKIARSDGSDQALHSFTAFESEMPGLR